MLILLLKEYFTNLVTTSDFITRYFLPRPMRLRLLEREASMLWQRQGSAAFLRKYGLVAFGEMQDLIMPNTTGFDYADT